MAAPVLRVEHVHKTYPGRFGRPPFHAVSDVSFAVGPGEILGLLAFAWAEHTARDWGTLNQY